MAGNSLVTLRIMFEALIYASCALILPLVLLPGGIKFISSWVFLNIWIQLWPPLYGILNYITLLSAQKYAKSILGGLSDGYSMFTSAGFQDLALDTAALGEYLSLSVPVLSFYLLQHVQSWANIAGSLLTPAHSASTSVASELSAGNYSYANTSIGQFSYDNQTAFQQNSAPSLASGYFTDNYGTHQIKYGADQLTVNQDPSHLNTSLSMADAYTSSLQSAQQQAQTQMDTAQQLYSETKGIAQRSTADFIQHVANSETFSKGYSTSEISAVQESANWVKNAAESWGHQYGISERDSLEYYANMGLGGSFLIEARSGHGENCAAISDEARQAATNSCQSKDFQEHYQRVLNYSHAEAGNQLNDEGKRYAENLSSAMENLKSSQDQYSQAICLVGFFFYRGMTAKHKKHLEGAKIVSSFTMALKLKFTREASPIKLGALPLVKGIETQHPLITGGTGSGKTNCMHHILTQLQQRSQKAIIVDTTGIFIQRYFREGRDLLLNPFDQRGVAWSPWAEGVSAIDYADLAEALIPCSHLDNENYWRMASRTVFVSLLQKFSDTQKTSDIVRWLQYESLGNLCRLMSGTKAAAHLDISSEKTASSVRSVCSTFLECLEILQDTSQPFSMHQWLAKKEDAWLFLPCTPIQRAILRPLISAWISSAIRGLLAMPVDLRRRIWFAIDELPSLQKVKDLESLLTEGRKYGGCAILSLQSPAQLKNIYGRETTRTIIGNTGTKIIFKERDPEIAAQISKAFGEREVLETQEGISYGAHETRDSVSLTMQQKTRPVVSASQILDLPLNTAYVKLAGEKLVVRTKLPII